MWQRDQAGIRLLRKRCDDVPDLDGIVHTARCGLDCQSQRRILDRLPKGLMYLSFNVHDRQRPGDMGRSFLEHLKPLATHRWCVTGETGDISARAGKTCNKATADRVADTNKYNRYVSGEGL